MPDPEKFDPFEDQKNNNEYSEKKNLSMEELQDALRSKGYIVVQNPREIDDTLVNRDFETKNPIDYLRHFKGNDDLRGELKTKLPQEMTEEEKDEALEKLKESGYYVYSKLNIGL